MDYHIKKTTVDIASISYWLHVPAPTGDNLAGKAWSEVLRSVRSSKSAVLGLREEAEEEFVAISKGQTLEVPLSFTFSDPDLNNAQRLAELEAEITQNKIDIADTASDLYKETLGIYAWSGYSGNV